MAATGAAVAATAESHSDPLSIERSRPKLE